jgi:hypothetical protein
MTFVWLAWLLAATPSAPTLWLELDVEAGCPCSAEGLEAAIRGLRPGAVVKLGTRPNITDLQILLVERKGSLSLTTQGRGEPLIRTLPPAGSSCTETSQTAALIIDRYLDELYANDVETPIAPAARSLAPNLQLRLGLSFLQMPSGLSPSISPGAILELNLGLGLVLLSLGGEANLSGTKPVTSQGDGSYRAQPAATWLAAGISPRLGPGRLGLQGSFGLSLLWVQTDASLHQETRGHAVDPYVGLLASYFIDLPSHFSLGLRAEERFVPSPTVFITEGVPGSASVAVRQFTADLALLAGYTFF